jgi:pyruvate formate lyase activating enzyme
MKEALFYKKLSEKKVRCFLCPQNCTIEEGSFGFCGVRKNKKGKLYSLVYGKPISLGIDPIEKKPLYHFYPGNSILSLGTFGCNLSCMFCQNFEISQVKQNRDLEQINENIEYFSPKDIIDKCINNKISFLAFTYTEPTIFYEYMFDIAKLAKKNNIKTVSVSNGQINTEPLKKLLPYIDAFNIDLKAFNKDFYNNICNGSFSAVKNTIKQIIKARKHLEITLLLIKGHNDNKKEFEEMCGWLSSLSKDIVLHISRAFPYYKMDFEVTPVSLMKDFEKIAKKYLDNVYLGNI